MKTNKLRGSMFMTLLWITVAAADAEGQPRSFSTSNLALQEIEPMTLAAVDHQLLIQKANEEESRLFGQPLIYAEPIAVEYSTDDSGSWDTLTDGSHVWRLGIRSPGALNLSLHFDRFELPPGAQLWIYNAAGDHVQGPYGVNDRNSRGELWTALVYGDEAVIELNLPATSLQEPATRAGRSQPRSPWLPVSAP